MLQEVSDVLFDGLSDITLEFMLKSISNDLKILQRDAIDLNDLKISGAQDAICVDDLNINPIPNGKIHEQNRSGLKAKTLAPRFVRVNIDDSPSSHIPIIHHTVVDRFHSVTKYRPYALRNIKYSIMDENGDIGSSKQGIVDL